MKIDIPVSQPYSVDIAPGLLDDLGPATGLLPAGRHHGDGVQYDRADV